MGPFTSCGGVAEATVLGSVAEVRNLGLDTGARIACDAWTYSVAFGAPAGSRHPPPCAAGFREIRACRNAMRYWRGECPFPPFAVFRWGLDQRQLRAQAVRKLGERFRIAAQSYGCCDFFSRGEATGLEN